MVAVERRGTFVVEPPLGVAVRFLESIRFEKRDELRLGVRGDDDIEIGREARIERRDGIATDKDVPMAALSEVFEEFDECVTPIAETHGCARSVSR